MPAWRAPSPPLSTGTAASWVEVDDPWNDWDVVSDGESSSSLSSASTSSTSSLGTLPPFPEDYSIEYPPLILTRILKQGPTPLPPSPPPPFTCLPPHDHDDWCDCTRGTAGIVTQAALGLGFDLSYTGKRCGLRVITGYDVTFAPSRKARYRRSKSRRTDSDSDFVCASTRIPNKHSQLDSGAPPPRRYRYDKKWYEYSSRSWRRTIEEMWERERDSSRFPYNMDWGIAAALHLPRQFGRLQWLTADNPARMVLYPGTGGPYPAHRLDISHWLKITAAISMYIADRFVKNPYTYAHGGQVQEYDWPRVRRLVMHPTGRLTQHRNTSPAIAAQLSPDSISWLLGQAGARPQVRHKVPLERKCRWGNWFVGPKMVLFLNCVVELEVRAHKIWEAARDAGELDEEWTPYGPIGSWWPCGRVSPALRGEYAAEPLPETRAVRILAAASPHSFNHLFNSNSELRDLCVACGPDVWPEVRSGKATARYSGSV